MSTPTLDQIVSLCKRRGFVFPTSEIYGGLANSYDYGPLGAQLMRRIRDLWWTYMIDRRDDMVGLDSQILLNPKTWVASGHVASFTDPLVEDKITHKRFRADHLIEEWIQKLQSVNPKSSAALELWSSGAFKIEDLTINELSKFIDDHHILSPDGNPITPPMSFNLLFESAIGSVSDEKAIVYLRGETAQGIFTNFKQILDSTRLQLPFGVGQIGKSFRNEITTGQFIFRTLEFEQAEIEYFFDPRATSWEELFASWKTDMWSFLTEVIGLKAKNLRWRRHTDKERSHYSLDTFDLEYLYPFGWKEMWGIAYRTDYDLKQHIEFSGKSLEYVDPVTQQKMVPHVIEPALGINRLFLAILCDSFVFDEERSRTLLQLSSNLAGYDVAVFPLVKNKPQIVSFAKNLYHELKSSLRVTWDERGNIGKRYLSQDEIGTPWCITVDYQTLEDKSVTLRNRDTTAQQRISQSEIIDFIHQHRV